MNYVIGSGPAGVAAAAALLELGAPVTMLDAGGRLEPSIQQRADAAGARPPEEWTAADRDALRGPLRYNSEGAPLKLAFGSDYVYRDVDRLQPVVTEGVDAYRALAEGGLSVLWGAAVLPYAHDDFAEWPVSAAGMSAFYAAALRMTGLAADDDRLARLYPLHMPPTTRVERSGQAQFVMSRIAEHAAELERRHIYAGSARLAIGGSRDAAPACAHCGMCLYGCPYGLIYSAQGTLRTRLMRSPHFTYRPGFVVRQLQERAGSVAIDAVVRETLAPARFEASRVYLAAGALPSTAILLSSLPGTQAVTLRQSDHFLLPLLVRRRQRGVARERLHTLSQLFVEILDPRISRRGVHLQLYTYNDHYERMANQRLGPLARMAAPFTAAVIERLALFKGYLHSDDSSAIRATLDRHGDIPELHLTTVPNPQARAVVRDVARLLARNGRRMGVVPIRPALRMGLPGSGVHVGGSFPMRRQPAGTESDVLGRPAGFTRVHAVDATVFPTMPAAPPTLTIMANAFRIATESQQAEGVACPA